MSSWTSAAGDIREIGVRGTASCSGYETATMSNDVAALEAPFRERSQVASFGKALRGAKGNRALSGQPPSVSQRDAFARRMKIAAAGAPGRKARLARRDERRE